MQEGARLANDMLSLRSHQLSKRVLFIDASASSSQLPCKFMLERADSQESSTTDSQENSSDSLPAASSKSVPNITIIIPLSPSPLRSAKSELLEDDQIKSEKKSLEARADDNMTGKHGKMEPNRTCSTIKI